MVDQFARVARASIPCVLLLVGVAMLVTISNQAVMTRVGLNFFVSLILVVGIQLFSGNTGIVSFGHVAFMGVGAYVAALLTIPKSLKSIQFQGLPSLFANTEIGMPGAIAVGALAAGAVAFVVGLALMRMDENAIAMATIALLVIFQVIASNWRTVTNGSVGVFGVPGTVTLWIAVSLCAAVVVFALWFRYSTLGLKTRGTREDSLAAAALGANVTRLRLITWTVSAVVMGVGGAVWASVNTAFTPGSFNFVQTFTLLAMLVLGGIESVSGAVLGAALVATLNEVLRRAQDGGIAGFQMASGWSAMIVPVVILLALIWRPTGVVGRTEWGDDLARRLNE